MWNTLDFELGAGSLANKNQNFENNFVCLCNKNVIDTSYYYDG